MKKMIKLAAIAGLLAVAGCGQIDADEAGFKTWFGKVDTPVLDAGLYWVNPIGGSMHTYYTRDLRSDIKMQAYTKDMQQADFEVSVIHAIKREKLVELHTQYGKLYAKVIIEPVMQAAIKDVVGQWEADKLVNGREEATKAIAAKVNELVADKPVVVKTIAILNIDYSDVFEKSIESKQVAAQKALEAKNKTAEIEEEARQKLITARSIAESMAIYGRAIKENRDLIFYEAIQKWDGKAPQYLAIGSNGINPVIDITGK